MIAGTIGMRGGDFGPYLTSCRRLTGACGSARYGGCTLPGSSHVSGCGCPMAVRLTGLSEADFAGIRDCVKGFGGTAQSQAGSSMTSRMAS